MKNILYLIISLSISFSLVSCEKENDIGGGSTSTDNNYIKVYEKSSINSTSLTYTIIPDGQNYKVYNKNMISSSELAYTIVFPQ